MPAPFSPARMVTDRWVSETDVKGKIFIGKGRLRALALGYHVGLLRLLIRFSRVRRESQWRRRLDSFDQLDMPELSRWPDATLACIVNVSELSKIGQRGRFIRAAAPT